MQNESQYDYVSFDNPPVAEVALTVQFEAGTVGAEALGQFAMEVRAELPKRQHQMVAPAIAETFDKAIIAPPFEIQMESESQLPRTLFLSEDGVQLVQLQHDRLTLNWREVGAGGEYPRYVALRRRFLDLLSLLASSLEDQEHELVVNTSEVTYVNPIEYVGKKGGHADLAKIINRLRTRPRDAFLPVAEDAQLNARWRIPGDELDVPGEAPAGRLYLSATPGLRPPENAPIYLVNLTARVLPSAGDLENAMKALDVGHKWVVCGFKDLTTSQMHRRWGLKEGAS